MSSCVHCFDLDLTPEVVSALYMIVLQHCEHFSRVTTSCMDAAIAAHTFKDTQVQGQKELIGSQIIVTFAEVLFEYVFFLGFD